MLVIIEAGSDAFTYLAMLAGRDDIRKVSIDIRPFSFGGDGGLAVKINEHMRTPALNCKTYHEATEV